jgi:chromosome partitioning protein
MRTIMTLNQKGGCGKSTLASNLASYYTTQGKTVALVDLDPQNCSLEWLKARDAQRPAIHGVPGTNGEIKLPKEADVVIYDAPAGVHGKDLAPLLKRVQTALIPVLPSPIDMRACAHFIQDILTVGRVSRDQVKLAVVANRVREHTLSYQHLETFLKALDIPFVATLRDTQNYIRAAERGLGIFELAPSSVEPDLEQWQPLVRWLNSKRSLPA